MHRERHHFSKMRNEENVEQQDKTRQDKKSNSFKFLFESKAQETIAYSFTSHSNNKKAKKKKTTEQKHHDIDRLYESVACSHNDTLYIGSITLLFSSVW